MPWRARANTAEAARSSTTTTTLALLTWSLWLLLRARSAAGAEAHAAGVEADEIGRAVAKIREDEEKEKVRAKLERAVQLREIAGYNLV